MAGSQKKQFYPVQSYRGHPPKTRYNRYDISSYRTFLAVENELDELLEQWPRDSRTVALLEDNSLRAAVCIGRRKM